MELSIRRSRRRTVALRVTRDAVILHAPHGVPETQLLRWVETKRDWLARAMRHFEERTPPAYHFQDGEFLPFLGETLTVQRAPVKKARRVGEILEVPDAPEPQARRAVEQWYRAQALAFFTPLSHEMAARLGVTVQDVKLTNARTRWGSCTASGVLRFNWRVLLASRDVAEYLCAHEVAHLRELNHSPRFWRLVAQLMPAHATARATLRDQGWRYTLGENQVASNPLGGRSRT